MKQLKCETCGSTLELNGDGLHAVCHTCGNVYEYRSPKEELAVQQMNEANDLRINMDFDEAIKKYRLVTKSNPEDAEGYWGLLLSKYGIAYECEPDTMKYVPTFHRNRRGNIREDASAQNALKYATPAQKETYEKALDELRYIQEGIEDFADNCDPYDVFISFKATEVGSDTKTIDRDIAYNIYDELNSRGIRTFFSEVSLRSMVAEDYEAVIFNALNTCRVFILVGTSKENIDSLWVKNEWTRYNERVADDRLNGLPQSSRFAVLGGTLKPSELPREFARTQNVMLSNYAGDSYKKDIAYSVETLLGIKKEETKPAIDENDVKAMVDRLVNERVAGNNTAAQPRTTAAPVTLENLTERIKMFIQNEDWENASEYVSRALDMSPHSSDIHHYKVLADNKVHDVSDLATCPYIFEKLIVRSKPYLTADIAAKVDAALLERKRLEEEKTERQNAITAKKNAIAESRNRISAIDTDINDIVESQNEIKKTIEGYCSRAKKDVVTIKQVFVAILTFAAIAIEVGMQLYNKKSQDEMMQPIMFSFMVASIANPILLTLCALESDWGKCFNKVVIGLFTLGVGTLIMNLAMLFSIRKSKKRYMDHMDNLSILEGISNGTIKDKSECKGNEQCESYFDYDIAVQQKTEEKKVLQARIVELEATKI